MTGDLLTPAFGAGTAPRLSAREWETLLAQARASRLAARLHVHLEQRGWLDQVPERPRQHLANARRHAERLQAEVAWEVEHLQRALAGLGCPVVLLKGAAYVAAGLPPARGRVFSDVDILVPRERLGEVERALFAAGWIAEKLQPYDDRYYRQWMHELPPLQHVQRQTTLDVHHTLTPPTSRFAMDGAPLLQASRTLPGSDLRVLAPADMVMHSAVHLMQDGDFSGGLRDLLDLLDLVRHFEAESGFWPALAARCQALGVQRSVAQALGQLERIAGLQVPEAVRGVLDTRAARSSTTGRLLEIALRPDHTSADTAGTALARWLLYVRSHWLRMPWYRIFPHLAYKAWRGALERATREPRAPQRQAG